MRLKKNQKNNLMLGSIIQQTLKRFQDEDMQRKVVVASVIGASLYSIYRIVKWKQNKTYNAILDEYFSQSYEESRSKFIEACKNAKDCFYCFFFNPQTRNNITLHWFLDKRPYSLILCFIAGKETIKTISDNRCIIKA